MEAVDFIVGVHNSPGLCLLDCDFKCGEINFAERSFVNNGVAGHSAGFLTVGAEMLERCADAHRLNTVDEACGKLTCKDGVFCEIFKVSAAERRTLHIDTGAEKHADFFLEALFAESNAHFKKKLGVP